MGIDVILENHRSLTAERRRDAMRMRLINAAISVFATRGRSGVVIADVIKAAKVSRGSFYNYYRTTDDLLADACHELSEEVVLASVEATQDLSDHVLRFAAGVHYVLATADAYPVFGQFAGNMGFGARAPQLDLSVMLRALMTEGREAGVFNIPDLAATCDMIEGTIVRAVARISAEGPPADSYHHAIVATVLRGLGVDATRADRVARIDRPVVVLPPEALLAVAQQDADTTITHEVRDA